MNNSGVIHRWAQDDPTLRVVRAENLFYENTPSFDKDGNKLRDVNTLFSYGHHFVIGAFVNAEVGRVCLFNADKASVTTSRHQGEAKAAARHHPCMTVKNPRPKNEQDHRDNIVGLLELAEYLEAKAKRSRTYGVQYAENALRFRRDAHTYASWFGLGSIDLTNILAESREREARLQEEYAARVEESARLQMIRDQENQKARRAQYREHFDLWLSGSFSPCPSAYWTDEDGSVYLRRKADFVETSANVKVPWEDALKVFRFAKLCRARCRGWKNTIGSKVYVGDFSLDAVSETGDLTIGCHFLSWKRISELAEKENVLDTETESEEILGVREEVSC